MTATARGMAVCSLNADWLNQSRTIAGDTITNDTVYLTGNCYNPWPWWYVQPVSYPVYYPVPAGKIRLTLSEVDALRAAAKKDKKLREALAKFTDHIEVEVDFPG